MVSPRVCSIRLLIFVLICVVRSESREELPNDLIPICSESGSKILDEPRARKANYETMMVQGTTQLNNAFCGVASSVVAFNSISNLTAPLDEAHGYHYWNQYNFFSDAVSDIISFFEVEKEGITLDQLGKMIGTWKYGFQENATTPGKQIFTVKTTHASDTDIDTFRTLAWEGLATTGRVIVNFRRDLLGQNGTYGHFSPLVAFSPEEDMFLLSDVARYKFNCPTYWVPTQTLWDAMNSVDPTSNVTRGYILIDTDVYPEPESPQDGINTERVVIVIMGGVYLGIIGLILVLFVISLVGCFDKTPKALSKKRVSVDTIDV